MSETNSPANRKLSSLDSPSLSRIVLIRGLVRGNIHWGVFPQKLKKELNKALENKREKQLGKSSIIPIELAGNGDRFNQASHTSVIDMMEDVRRQYQHQITAQSTSGTSGISNPLDRSPSAQPDNIKTVVIAISMGAMVAHAWACRYPDEVAELHLINTSMADLSPWFRRFSPSALPAPVQALFASIMFNRGDQTHNSNRNTFRQKLELQIQRLTMNKPLSNNRENELLAYSNSHPISPINLLRQLWAAARYKSRVNDVPQKASADIASKLYLYCSEQDRLVHKQCSMDIARFYGLDPSSIRLCIHPTAGHDLPADEAQWLATEIAARTFISDNDH